MKDYETNALVLIGCKNWTELAALVHEVDKEEFTEFILREIALHYATFGF